jgi:hypothetical protein
MNTSLLNKKWLSFIALKFVCFCVFANPLELPRFPEIKADSSDVTPMSLQLALTTDHVIYRKPVDLYVRFVNNGKDPVYIPSGLTTDPYLRAKIAGPGFLRCMDLTGNGVTMILLPGQPMVIRIPNYLFPIGKQRFNVKLDIQQENNKTIELSSNDVEIAVENKPLDGKEKHQYNQYYNRMIEELCSSEDYKEDENYLLNIQRNFIVGSPISVTALQQFSKRYLAINGRIHAVEILGMIADKEQTTAVGYIRDTSSADLVIERIGKEPDAGVKVAWLKIVGKFFDVLTPPQRETLEKTVLAQLAQADAGVRVQAALTLLELFPKQRTAIETALAKADFADAAGRKTIAEAMAKAKVSNP